MLLSAGSVTLSRFFKMVLMRVLVKTKLNLYSKPVVRSKQ